MDKSLSVFIKNCKESHFTEQNDENEDDVTVALRAINQFSFHFYDTVDLILLMCMISIFMSICAFILVLHNGKCPCRTILTC
jgi:hypothetical protein